MPEKEGAEEKSTKSVVNKKQKLGEEGYDIARDMGKVRPSKNKKDATTMRPSKEMKKTQKVNKGPSAFERVKAKYGKSVMKLEELDLTQVAEAFGGYIVEAPVDDREEKKNRAAKKLAKAAGINIRTQGPEQAAATQAFKDMRMSKEKKFSNITPDVKSGMRATAAGKGKAEPKKRATRANYPKTRAELEAKRKEYEIDRQGKATDAGVEKFARRRKQSNLPLSKDELDSAKKAMVGTGEKGTDVGKYGGRLGRRRGKDQPTFAQVKADIDDKNPVRTSPVSGGKTPDARKPKAFIGDKPPEKDQQKPPDRESGQNIFDKNKIKGGERKDGKVELPTFAKAVKKATDFAKKNPALGYASYDLGKGIIGKLMKVKGALPGVVGGTVGRRSARGGGGL